ncbi:MAG: hypothetical protein ISS35_03865 [Kiritimatiellae bacterium]|nr:hypothetical protein [Kiritimatiellia bacterium]
MMNQLLLGSAIPFAVALLIYLLRRCRASLPTLVITPLAMLLGALWAVIPDLPRIVGKNDLYLRWSKDPRMNLFFWHYSIDLTESDSPWYAAGIAVLLALLLAAAWQQLSRMEREAQWPT